MFLTSCILLSGFPCALPGLGPHYAVSTSERQRTPVDLSERGASDVNASSRSGFLTTSSGFLPGGHRDTTPFLAAWGGIHWPKKPQICHEAAVGNLSIKPAPPDLPLPTGFAQWQGLLWMLLILSLSPVCNGGGKQGDSPTQCFVFIIIIIDYLISNCDQLGDFQNLDSNRCLDIVCCCFDICLWSNKKKPP